VFYLKAHIISALLMLTIGSACATEQATTAKTSEESPIDLNSLLGRWLIVARIPSFLEKGTQRVTVTYTQLDSNLFTTSIEYDRGSFAQRSNFAMTSWFDDPGIYRHWRERFFGPITFASVVVSVDKETLILRSPNSKSFWLLSRDSRITEQQKHTFQEILNAAKIDIQKVEWVNHSVH
jgi:apolipoprotein D and lipocalin family protein